MQVSNNKPTPRIAAVLPVYNTAMYLRECLDSICNQTYSNFVIFAVDDGSTDNSLEILNSYQSKDSRIRAYSKENGGVSSARNFALNKIAQDNQGFDLVCFIDSDDVVGEDFFKFFVEALRTEDFDYIVCGWKVFNQKGFVEDERRGHHEIIVDQNETFEHFFKLGQWANANYSSSARFLSNKCFSSSVALCVRFNEGLDVSEDQDYIIRALLHVKKGVIYSKENYFYRLRASSLVHTGLKVEAMHYYENLLSYYPLLPPKGQEGVLIDAIGLWWLSVKARINDGTYDKFKKKFDSDYAFFKNSPYVKSFSKKIKKRLFFYGLGWYFLKLCFGAQKTKQTQSKRRNDEFLFK